MIVFAAAIVSAVVLAVAERLAYNSPLEIPQGRYLFPVVVPIAMVYALGLWALLPKRFFGPGRALGLTALALAGVDLISFFGALWPFYR